MESDSRFVLFADSLKDVGESEADRLPTFADSSKLLPGVSEDCSEGIPVGDNCA